MTMSCLSDSSPDASAGEEGDPNPCRTRHDADVLQNTPPTPGGASEPSLDDASAAFQFTFQFPWDSDDALALPATQASARLRSASLQPSEASEGTILGTFHDGGALDNASSSVTLQDAFPWHPVDAHKSTPAQRIPSTIVPALLQSIDDVSPSWCTSSPNDAQEVDANELEERDSDEDAEDALPQFSAAQKGKWKAPTEKDAPDDGAESPELYFESVNDIGQWVAHNRPILREYADRQVSLPLGRRLKVSINEPSKFILGTLNLLINRDKDGRTDPSRRLGPQLIENFVEIDRWTKEYLRSRHDTRILDNDIPTLLTIVLNNFYEAQVQLIDRIISFALERMRFCGRHNLGLEDFSFGFEFKMSQDLPFHVETASLLRKARAADLMEALRSREPVTTSSGRLVKPSQRAQDVARQAQATANRKPTKKTGSQNKKKLTNDAPPPPTVGPTVPETSTPLPLKTVVVRKYRPPCPSNLRLPPIPAASSAVSTATPVTLPLGDGNDMSKWSGTVLAKLDATQSSSGVPGANVGNRASSPCLKIKLPAKSLIGAASREPVSSTCNESSVGKNAAPVNVLRTGAEAQANLGVTEANSRDVRRSERVRMRPVRSYGRPACAIANGAVTTDKEGPGTTETRETGAPSVIHGKAVLTGRSSSPSVLRGTGVAETDVGDAVRGDMNTPATRPIDGPNRSLTETGSRPGVLATTGGGETRAETSAGGGSGTGVIVASCTTGTGRVVKGIVPESGPPRLEQPSDPSHWRRKKRKLDDSDA